MRLAPRQPRVAIGMATRCPTTLNSGKVKVVPSLPSFRKGRKKGDARLPSERGGGRDVGEGLLLVGKGWSDFSEHHGLDTQSPPLPQKITKEKKAVLCGP
ncbi:hypothetical protein CDAR_317981 [Caerostris darwini]|uniref:Uncharacterized protein n=1 Tax=Caerostris darwini TaxID=1538125 RepID=A0AAV4WQZ4_9ARAC|nr:hypothetical protein CDAR_317981 [Caerostris darwini]